MDTAELTVPRSPGELAPPAERPPGSLAGPLARLRERSLVRLLVAPLARLRADPARALAVRDSWRALWSSRLLVWAAGVGVVLLFGFGPHRAAFNPPGVSSGFGWLGDLLAAPAARWDANWYLVIAHYGYHPALGAYTASRDAFFPLYPLGISVISALGVPPVAAGVLLSLGSLGLALYGLHRLTTLELGAPRTRLLAGSARSAAGVSRRDRGLVRVAGHEREATFVTRREREVSTVARPERLATSQAGRDREIARLAVYVCAFAPMAFFLSAVYSESLYLLLSIALFWSAREGRWAYVGILGALAGATRSTGLVLALPAVMLYLYGPRRDRVADFVRLGRARLLPRYRVRREALWLALIPAGVVAYGAYLALAGGDALAPFNVQQAWSRHFAGPYVGVWDGVRAAFEGARQLLSFQRAHLYFPVAGEDPFVAASHNLILFGFLAAAVAAVIGVLRTLPLAYGAYVLAALALPLSYPVSSQPLMSLPRFLLVLFPLFIWFASWLARHPRAQLPALACSAALMVLFGAQFTTWHWVS